MEQKINETPDENPIKCVLLVLGFLSFMAVFSAVGTLNGSLLKETTVLGIICGLCSLPIGFKLAGIKMTWKQGLDTGILS